MPLNWTHEKVRRAARVRTAGAGRAKSKNCQTIDCGKGVAISREWSRVASRRQGRRGKAMLRSGVRENQTAREKRPKGVKGIVQLFLPAGAGQRIPGARCFQFGFWPRRARENCVLRSSREHEQKSTFGKELCRWN